MPLLWFTVLRALGSGLWNGLLIGLGWMLGERWDQVGQYVHPVSSAVLIVLLALLARVVWIGLAWRRHQTSTIHEAATMSPSDADPGTA